MKACELQLLRNNTRTLVLLLLVTSIVMRAQAPNQEPLTNDDVVKMVAAQMDESKIIQMIQTEPGNFSLSFNSIAKLKQEGVPDAVLDAMHVKAPSALWAASASVASAQQLQAASSAAAPISAPDGVEDKRPGVIRVGIVMPRVQLGQRAQGPSPASPCETFSPSISPELPSRPFLSSLLPPANPGRSTGQTM